MSNERLTGKRAVWFGLLATPVLLVAAITLVGVTAGSAGPTTSGPAAAARTSQVVGGPVSHTTALGSGQQTLAELKAYWSAPGRMANAIPVPAPTAGTPSIQEGTIQAIHEVTRGEE